MNVDVMLSGVPYRLASLLGIAECLDFMTNSHIISEII